MENLRELLVQRAARLQERPALTAPGWGTLTWKAWRNRVEGVALGLMGGGQILRGVHCPGPPPWPWACEVAAACCGLRWDPSAPPVPQEVLGGPAFNAEDGRGPYHALERALGPATPFLATLDHGEVLARLRRLNTRLGWDHETVQRLPPSCLGSPEARGALWSLLYAGGHAVLEEGAPWDPGPFEDLLL
ncbi:MAG: hypothetical protein HY823_15335 [Acidobacteria bacterium]|nr:hypothetical protein [Acidobacteriota bacterium]